MQWRNCYFFGQKLKSFKEWKGEADDMPLLFLESGSSCLQDTVRWGWPQDFCLFKGMLYTCLQS